MLEKSKLFVSLVLLLAVSSKATSSCSTQTTAELLAALRKHFSYGDVIQLVASLSDQKAAIQISRHLNSIPVLTNVQWTCTSQYKVARFQNSSNHIFFLHHDASVFIANNFNSLSEVLSSSRPRWVFFSEETETIEQLFEGTDVPFNSEVLVASCVNEYEIRLTEVYRIAANLPLKTPLFGTWTGNGGLVTPSLGLYDRRNSLEGLPIRSSNVHDPPLSIISQGPNNSVVLGGFCGKVWSILEKQMQFRSRHSIAAGTSGNPWQDMLEAVIFGEADVASSYMAQTASREVPTDFSFPVLMIPFRLFIAQPEGLHGKLESIVYPFSWRLWTTIILFTLFFTLAFYWSGRLLGDANRASFCDSLFVTLSAILCHQGLDFTPRLIGFRMMFVLMHGLGLVVSASYGAALLSNLAIVRRPLPFQTLNELSSHGGFELGTTSKSIVHMRFINSRGGLLKQLADKYFSNPKNTPTLSQKGFERACKIPFAFISLSESLSIIRDKLNCSLVALPQHFTKFSAALAFPLNSPYRGLFNHNLLKLIGNGVLRDLHRAVLNEPTATPPADAEPIEFDQVMPVLAVLFLGAGAAAVQLLMGKVAQAIARRKGAAIGVWGSARL